MKYKLINKQTGEEHICEKVVIDGWDYYVSDEEYIEDELLYCVANGWLQKARVEHLVEQRGNDNQWKKVIASNNPNIDIPNVVDEVEMLANIEYPFAFGGIGNIENTSKNHFIKGYNKSQETHPNSDDDMIEFYEWCQKPSLEDLRQPNVVYIPSGNFYWHKHKKYTPKELLQLWKEQRIKTIYYE